MKKASRQAVLGRFDMLVGALGAAIPEQRSRSPFGRSPSLEVFRGAQPMLPVGSDEFQCDDMKDDYFFFGDAKPTDVPVGTDVKFLIFSEEEGVDLQLSRFRWLGPKARRRFGVSGLSVIREDTAFVTLNPSSFMSVTTVLSWRGGIDSDGFPIMIIPRRSGLDSWTSSDINSSVGSATGAAFTNRYSWFVELSRGKGFSLRFPTDPRGAMAAFRNREKKKGKSRRSPMKHWVRDHWRTTSIERITESQAEERATLIREHLRGVIEFEWEGLSCRLTPSAFDLERAGKSMERPLERSRVALL